MLSCDLFAAGLVLAAVSQRLPRLPKKQQCQSGSRQSPRRIAAPNEPMGKREAQGKRRQPQSQDDLMLARWPATNCIETVPQRDQNTGQKGEVTQQRKEDQQKGEQAFEQRFPIGGKRRIGGELFQLCTRRTQEKQNRGEKETAAQQDDQCVEHGDTPPCRSLYGSLTVSISYKQQHFHCSAYRDSWKRKNQRRSREDIEIQQDDINVKGNDFTVIIYVLKIRSRYEVEEEKERRLQRKIHWNGKRKRERIAIGVKQIK